MAANKSILPANHPRVVTLIPAFNEERFIGDMVLKAGDFADVVIVVDDGSSDATAEIARAAGAIVVRHERNQGKGAALNTGFRKARELEPAVVVTIDGDGQHLPEEMPKVAAPVFKGEADIVIGSRYLEKRNEVPLIRILGHLLFNFLTNAVSGTSITDSQSGFRAFSPRALQTISFQSSGFAVESEMQFLARDYDLRLGEVPITVRYQGRPKRNVFIHGLAVLSEMLRLVGQRQRRFGFAQPPRPPLERRPLAGTSSP
ncbi:MAG: glycosyltransferase family 2 protein [Chloroflexi bacterium]|nr:glycosyltransferase family 2 protein [Chloroflexota bacterium]